jgi:RND family efflux transporter MFP subunit
VAKGAPLLEAYAPELLAAQREYAIASQGVQDLAQASPETQQSMMELAQASLARLRNWDMDAAQLHALARSDEVQRTVTLRAPVGGYVSEKKAVQGMRFMPGEVLYQISDLSSVWVLADVAEQDIALLRTGARARVSVGAYADKTFEATLGYIYPTLNSASRTVTVRLELPNRGGLLKPGMYAQVELPAGAPAPVLSVPLSAVIDSGVRQVALVQTAPGRFEPRELRLGARSEQHVQVLQGLREGEPVVVSANFLIDAESNLSAALSGLGAPAAMPGAAAGAGHQARGKVLEVDPAALSVTLSHGPVASLKWPAMTMDFTLAHSGLLRDLKPQASVDFEFVERGKGEWVITRVVPAGK